MSTENFIAAAIASFVSGDTPEEFAKKFTEQLAPTPTPAPVLLFPQPRNRGLPLVQGQRYWLAAPNGTVTCTWHNDERDNNFLAAGQIYLIETDATKRTEWNQYYSEPFLEPPIKYVERTINGRTFRWPPTPTREDKPGKRWRVWIERDNCTYSEEPSSAYGSNVHFTKEGASAQCDMYNFCNKGTN